MKRLALTLLATHFALAAGAQDELLEEIPEIRRYTVEAIVFSYAEDVSTGTEVFVADVVPEAKPFGIDDLLEIDQTPLPDPEEDMPPDSALDGEFEEEIPELVFLAEEELGLGDIMRQFELLEVYEPLLYVGWTQITRERDETVVIDIADVLQPPPGLSGSFTLYLSRYLHLIVDLELDADSETASQSRTEDTPVVRFGNERTGFDSYSLYVDPYEVEPAGPVIYRLQENRILKNGETRYFDHPKFGVVVKVTRVEEPEEESEEDAGSVESRQLFGGRDQ